MIVQMREDAVRIVQAEDVDESNGRMPPPIWVVVVVVAVVTGGWLLVTQGSTDTDPVTNPTLLPVTPDEASVVTTTTASVVTTPTASPTTADPLSVFGNPPISITAKTPQQLRGYVAVTSPDDPPFYQYTVWVLRPGGSLVSRADNVIGRGNVEYPMLITAGHLILGGRILDIDLAEPPISLWTAGSVIPGTSPGLVWLTQRVERIQNDSVWVSPVDVESLTVGERIEVTDLFSRPIVGVADGLIVVPVEQPSSFFGDELAFWSPTDGLVPLDLPGEVDTVVSALGDVVVVASTGRARFLNVVSGEYVGSVELLDIRGPVTSACLSPDGQYVIVVGWNGKAVVGNTNTGEVVGLNEVTEDYFGPGLSVQQEHGIGWTTDDQLVFIAGNEDAKHIFGFDLANRDSFHMATLSGLQEWWMTASGTLC
jgi:hypothetical protein